jgi:hypothetical protein
VGAEEEAEVIYDPLDQNICMNEMGVLFYLRAHDGGETDWVELNEMKRNGEFRRPEW